MAGWITRDQAIKRKGMEWFERKLVPHLGKTAIIALLIVFAITYLVSKPIKLGYEDAAPTAIIAGSNHFEVAIAVATTLFGVTPGAALATVVGVLTEVPIMLFLVWLCKRTRGFFS
ncbi:MAG: hypothetical protein QMD22_10110 [archaeon]|nr:hypothetical protein [archaeon]